MSITDISRLEDFLEAMAPPHDPIQQEMAERADEEGFPIIGRAAGGVLRQLAMASDAQRIFEFGSGYGYSATWFAPALPEDGTIVLTEEDPEELELAETYLERAGQAGKIKLEAGNALETIEEYEDPFDVVLIDVAKRQYPEAYERVRDKLAPGSVVIADNALMAGTLDTDGIVNAIVDDEADPALDESSDGIRRYLQRVRGDDALVTTVLPVGSGLAVSVFDDR